MPVGEYPDKKWADGSSTPLEDLLEYARLYREEYPRIARNLRDAEQRQIDYINDLYQRYVEAI